jgi:hypothetical protein
MTCSSSRSASALSSGFHYVLDLADGRLGPLAGLGALGLDAFLLGFQDVFIDTAVVERLQELLLLAGQFA